MEFKKRELLFCLGFGIWALGFSNTLVIQSGDTLKFLKNDSLISIRILKNEAYEKASGYYVEKAKISPDSQNFLLYEEHNFPDKESIFTRITFYNAEQNRIWSRTETGQRKILFELCKIYADKVTIITIERTNTAPQMIIINNDKSKKNIDLKQWTSITNYEISPNGRYALFHAKRPYNNRLWDYIYFYDLKTHKHWEYLFPFCFSCKRGWLELRISDEGISEVIYKNKNEHRIFDKEGNLINVFVKFE